MVRFHKPSAMQCALNLLLMKSKLRFLSRLCFLLSVIRPNGIFNIHTVL